MHHFCVEKEVILNLPMAYAVSFLNAGKDELLVCASEGLGGCFTYPRDGVSPINTVWENAGGCMSISQVAADGTFLAVQNFFKGFNAKEACLTKSVPDGRGGWETSLFLDFPYLHRFETIDVEDQKFIILSKLCAKKEFKEDWSKPGTVYLGKINRSLEPPVELEQLIPSLTKNHGFYRGRRLGRDILLISGEEGLFEVEIPKRKHLPWKVVKLLDREISDAAVVDIDGDGVEELVTIEGFHGDHIAVNKLQDGAWTEVYRYPAPFAHVVWGGMILGRQSLLLAYRNDNGALMLLRKSDKPGAYYMDHLVIDEMVSPTNCAVDSRLDCCLIHSCNGKTQQVVRYRLTMK